MRLARFRSLFFYCCCIIAAATVAGCVEVAEQNANETVYESSRWFGGTMIACGLLGAAFGVRLVRNEYRSIRWLGWTIVLLGLLFAGVVGPSPYFDELRVTPDYFKLNVGVWFARNIHRVDYADVEHVDLVEDVYDGTSGRSTSYYMEVYRKDRVHQCVPIGDMMKVALEEILGHYRDHNVPVYDFRTK